MASEISARIGGPRVELLRSLERLRRKHGRERTRGFDQGVHNVVVRGQDVVSPPSWLPSTSLLWHGNEMRCGTDAVVVNGSLRIRAGAAVRARGPRHLTAASRLALTFVASTSPQARRETMRGGWRGAWLCECSSVVDFETKLT